VSSVLWCPSASDELARLSSAADLPPASSWPSGGGSARMADPQPDAQSRSASEVVSYLELAISPDAPSWARRQTRISLESWRIDAELIEVAQLLVSELVTNAVKYARPGLRGEAGSWPDISTSVALILRYGVERLTILVSDPDPVPPVLATAGDDAEGGRGLMLVQALSKEWGHYCPPTGGKVVYCVLTDLDAS
jgi:anti-sigma regulatory factor (Ser/Thr protein kinase)